MTRKEFLQFMGASLVILFGFGNLITLMTHFTKIANTTKLPENKPDTASGFGSRKFGA